MHRAAMIRGKNFSKKKREKISMARQKIKRYRDILKDFIDADNEYDLMRAFNRYTGESRIF